MFDMFLTAGFAPFTIALVIMIGVGAIEAIGLGAGQFDVHADLDSDGGGASALDWLGLGSGLPILIWLTSFLGCFVLVGVALQQLATAMLGVPLHWLLAVAGALVVASFLNRFVAAGLARIMPGYESTVISTEDLIMRRGTVLEGSARRGHPARARVIDQHKQAHYVMVEPHNEGDVIAQGETAVLVRKEGPIFFVLPDAHPTLRPV